MPWNAIYGEEGGILSEELWILPLKICEFQIVGFLLYTKFTKKCAKLGNYYGEVIQSNYFAVASYLPNVLQQWWKRSASKQRPTHTSPWARSFTGHRLWSIQIHQKIKEQTATSSHLVWKITLTAVPWITDYSSWWFGTPQKNRCHLAMIEHDLTSKKFTPLKKHMTMWIEPLQKLWFTPQRSGNLKGNSGDGTSKHAFFKQRELGVTSFPQWWVWFETMP